MGNAKHLLDNEKWDIAQRLEFIDFRLFWHGKINRGDLVKNFRISLPQATADIKKYQSLAPDNMEYNRHAKIFHATSSFSPVIYEPNAEHALQELKSLTVGEIEHTFLGFTPDIGVLYLPKREMNVLHLREILRAIDQHHKIEIRYQSLTRLNPKWRWIAPHALATDGFRWHIRAFCYRTNSYRDFVIGRILDIRQKEPHDLDFQQDEAWNRFVDIKIGPHPGLTEDQQKIIASDYGMKQGKLVLKVRQSMLIYMLVLLRLDDERFIEERTPDEQQIVLLNRDELKPILPP